MSCDHIVGYTDADEACAIHLTEWSDFYSWSDKTQFDPCLSRYRLSEIKRFAFCPLCGVKVDLSPIEAELDRREAEAVEADRLRAEQADKKRQQDERDRRLWKWPI